MTSINLVAQNRFNSEIWLNLDKKIKITTKITQKAKDLSLNLYQPCTNPKTSKNMSKISLIYSEIVVKSEYWPVKKELSLRNTFLIGKNNDISSRSQAVFTKFSELKRAKRSI